jgi:predicted permease
MPHGKLVILSEVKAPSFFRRTGEPPNYCLVSQFEPAAQYPPEPSMILRPIAKFLSPHLESLAQDVRFALRMLRKNPAFTAVAILTLALGIGANTAIFSVVQGVLLAPLPYRQSDRLVAVSESNPRFPMVAVSYPNFLDRQRESHSFENMAALVPQDYDLASPGTPEHLDGAQISSGFFATLGAGIALGREFSPAEDIPGGPPVAIVSDRFWKDRFFGNLKALGKPITLNGVDYQLVGVLAPRFRFLADSDVYTPLGQGNPTALKARGSHWIFSYARLKPGVTASQAQAELETIQNGLDQLYPDANRDLGIVVAPLKKQIVGDASATLLLLFAAVGLVLLIACANVASLLLSRSTARRGEFAIRSALGATRGRVVRQLLTESALLSLAGGALGVLLALASVRPMLAALPTSLPHSENISVNIAVLSFALGLAMAAAILFGLAPALRSSAYGLQSSLKESGRSVASGHQRPQSILVVVQIALTLVLLVGAGLLFRTVRHLWNVNPGFDTAHVITFRVGISHSLTKTPASTRTSYEQLIDRMRRIPGVEAADFTDVVPLSGQGGTMPFWIGSQKPVSLQAAPRLTGFLAGPDYLQALGITLLRGRFFTREDTVQSPCVVAIDSDFAQQYFHGTDPIGQTISFGFATVGPCAIVGIVNHVAWRTLDAPGTRVQNEVYFPLYQDPDPWVADNYSNLTVVVRTPLAPAALMPAIKQTVYEASSDQPVFDIQTMGEIISKSMSPQRFPMILLAGFACLALLLASVGIYGVISYSVSQRIHEIGIRMALGAERGDIFRMVIRQVLGLAATGLAIGVVVAVMSMRALSSFSDLLYGVRTSDPLTFAAASLVLIAVALLACYIPARRAMRVDPITAMRCE